MYSPVLDENPSNIAEMGSITSVLIVEVLRVILYHYRGLIVLQPLKLASKLKVTPQVLPTLHEAYDIRAALFCS